MKVVHRPHAPSPTPRLLFAGVGLTTNRFEVDLYALAADRQESDFQRLVYCTWKTTRTVSEAAYTERPAMSESKAAESYNAFEALRNRFGETKKPLKSNRNLSRSKSKDPRSNAPPLVPLIEEGDQTQQAFFQGTRPVSRVTIGCWCGVLFLKLLVLARGLAFMQLHIL